MHGPEKRIFNLDELVDYTEEMEYYTIRVLCKPSSDSKVKVKKLYRLFKSIPLHRLVRESFAHGVVGVECASLGCTFPFE